MILEYHKNEESTNKPVHLWLIDFQQGIKTFQWGKNSLFNNGAGTNGFHMQKMKLDQPASHHIHTLTQNGPMT